MQHKTKNVQGWTMPAYETHYPQEFIIHNTDNYQIRQRNEALNFCDQRRHAIDIGANIGLWGRDFCKNFEHVTMFEPDEINRFCLAENLKNYENKTIYAYGLYSSEIATTLFGGDHTCGNKSISKEAIMELSDDKSNWITETACELRVLDNFEFENVDFMKLDTQGSELDILKGSLKTIEKCSPTICVEITTKNEQQKKEAKVMYDFFDSIGYKHVGGYKKDKVFKKKV
jgi:FkbM family methyltransferase